MKDFTLIVPYYRQPLMLREQIRIWEAYPENIRIILVDDGSPEEAQTVIRRYATKWLRQRLDLYRIEIDLAWNRGGARNLGTKQAQTDWVVHVDIDHVLTGDCAAKLLRFEPDPRCWYRFERYRNGAADETRKKDKIPPELQFGKIHPHIDSYLCTRKMYWQAGGYNESFSGCLGGGSPFLAEMTKLSTPKMLPPDVHLQVYTRSVISDASVSLNRGRDEFARRKLRMKGRYKGENPIRFPWSQVSWS